MYMYTDIEREETGERARETYRIEGERKKRE